MKGLLVKDLYLMNMRKSFWGLLILLSGAMIFTGMEPSFVVCYLTIMASFMALGTISYDEMDHGNAFLFTLPVSRKSYVMEKYILGIVMGVVGLVCSVLLIGLMVPFAPSGLDMSGWQSYMLQSLFALVLLVSFMFPMQFKFGGEKSRVAVAILAAGVVVIGLAANKLFDYFQINVGAWFSPLLSLSEGVRMALIFLALLICAAVSYGISVRIMERKEF